MLETAVITGQVAASTASSKKTLTVRRAGTLRAVRVYLAPGAEDSTELRLAVLKTNNARIPIPSLIEGSGNLGVQGEDRWVLLHCVVRLGSGDVLEVDARNADVPWAVDWYTCWDIDFGGDQFGR